MSSGTFQHLQDLRTLTLRGNKIHQLSPRLFVKLTKLRTLDLSDNNIQHLVPEVFKDVQELRTFSCRRCNLRNMNPHIYSLLSSLANLDLGENQFKYLDKEEFRDLKKLTSLRLDGNHFPVVLEGTFASQGRLQYLDLSRSQIAKVTNHAFDNLTALIELDLSYNKLDRLEPVTFQPLAPNLRSLLVSGNNIRVEEFILVLRITSKLRYLAMADLDVKEGLPLGLLAHVESLKHLNLSGNGLTRFQYQLLSVVPKLSLLDLSRNRLHSLDEGSVARMELISTVYLQDNPWACDLCHIMPMFHSNASWMPSVICALPNHLRGRYLDSLKSEELSLCSSGLDYKEEGFAGLALTHRTRLGLIAAGSAVAILVITMAAVIAGLLYNRNQTAFFYNSEQKSKETQDVCNSFVAEKKLSIATIDEITKEPEPEDQTKVS
ncbi:carboxypeptidase N subunit 2 [Halyomorpha halys]|uniref:carboxypeptidase N subunit 2 n=1 Tax=Halyomorpha halys TaxID=286706 RepID=UPI0006D4FA56|nr:carboxypeptidase N subunit 2 [Halyomorpha halys]